MSIKFEITDKELENIDTWIEETVVSKIKDNLQYRFTSGGGIGLHVIKVYCSLTDLEENVTDYDSW